MQDRGGYSVPVANQFVPGAGSDPMAMLTFSKNGKSGALDAIENFAFFAQFAEVRCYLQSDLDAFNQCQVDNPPGNVCTLSSSAAFSGIGLYSELFTNFFELLPYAQHPLD